MSSIVIGIDLGTTFSGYACGMDKVEANPPWPMSSGYAKAPTAIVMDATSAHNVIKFGYEAEEFMSHKENKTNPNYLYFREFKMVLIGLNTGVPLIKAQNVDVSLPVDLVFGRVIRYISDRAKGFIIARVPGYDLSKIKWVITVPAIWTPMAKNVMVNAATDPDKGGLPRENLNLALEPEAAAMTCITDGVGIQGLKVGSQYAVVDCGGGTLDITIHMVSKIEDKYGKEVMSVASRDEVKKITVKEVQEPVGGPFGSKYVNDGIIDLLKEIFGDDVVERYKAVGKWMDLTQKIDSYKRSCNLETLKRTEKGEDENCFIELPLNDDDNGNVDELKARVKRFNERHPDHSLKIKYDELMGIPEFYFVDAIKKVVRGIGDTLNRLLTSGTNRIRLIFLVGGFSQSEILSDVVRKVAARSGCEFIHPFQPGAAIMTGAVYCGVSQIIHTEGKCPINAIAVSIESRVSAYSYGVETNETWSEERHHLYERHKTTIEGKDYCKDVYREYVEVGQRLRVDDPPISKKFSPLREAQTRIQFNVYCHKKRERGKVFVDDPSVTKIGGLSISVPYMNKPLDEREVTCEFSFSGTVLVVRVTNPETGETKIERINTSLK